MKHLFFTITSAFILLIAATPASAKKVVVNSEPAGAAIYINGVNTHQSTPAIVKVPNKKQLRFSFRKDGYDNGELLVTKQLNIKGKKKLPKEVSYRLTPSTYTPYKNDPTIVAGQANAMVSRDNPGQTALEQTIIRWYFDSDPRGARISWRVISSIPSEVKNTNETYLMTTPFEETRSFNIMGLTYENSRDVTIEIKVVKKGFEDQIKRFNVRQAIDQQEISSFFELVPRVQ